MIELKLTIEEANKILAALGQQSYVDVYQLIEKIKEQAAGQTGQESGTENE